MKRIIPIRLFNRRRKRLPLPWHVKVFAFLGVIAGWVWSERMAPMILEHLGMGKLLKKLIDLVKPAK